MTSVMPRLPLAPVLARSSLRSSLAVVFGCSWLHSEGRQDRVEFRCGFRDFVVGIGFGDDAATRVRVRGAAIGRQLRAADRHHPPAVTALVAPADGACVEAPIALQLV